MRRVVRVLSVPAVVLLTAAFTFSTVPAAADPAVPDPARSAQARAAVSRLPLAFEPNSGQAPADVRYVSQAAEYRLWLAAGEARFAASRPSAGDADAIRLRWLGGADAPAVVAEDPQPGKAHYYTGSDRSQWRENVPMYGRVVYRGVYPGIDLVFHGTQRDTEFDFVVRPGADPRTI